MLIWISLKKEKKKKNLCHILSKIIFKNWPLFCGRSRTIFASKNIPLPNQGQFSKISLFVQKQGCHSADKVGKNTPFPKN